MIFVTVGSQLPFDRLIVAIDEWSALNTETKVIVQAGKSNFESKYFQIENYIEPSEWGKLVKNADLVIGHAGMGTILNCIDLKKPLVIMPRQFSLGEIRNDHQLATTKYFENVPGIYITHDAESLFLAIKSILEGKDANIAKNNENLEHLISELRGFSNNIS